MVLVIIGRVIGTDSIIPTVIIEGFEKWEPSCRVFMINLDQWEPSFKVIGTDTVILTVMIESFEQWEPGCRMFMINLISGNPI